MMLRWITNNCLSKPLQSPYNDIRNYVLFLDDDFYLNIDALVKYLKLIDDNKEMTTYERKTFIYGYVVELSYPQRHHFGRWHVSMIDYPYDHYPPYVAGGCILMTRYTARLFYIASKYTPLFHWEDVYLGMLAYSMSIHLVKNNTQFVPDNGRVNLNQAAFLSLWRSFLGAKININEPQICVRGYRGEQLLNIWNKLYQTNLKFSLIDLEEENDTRANQP